MASILISHWHQRFDNTQLSSMDFYQELYAAIRDKELPGINMFRVTYTEVGLFSARREYFRVQHNEYMYDICAAPFGKNFFISYWHSEISGCLIGLIAMIPFIGKSWAKYLLHKTFYQQDSEILFKESLLSILRQTIDSIHDSGRGLRRLADHDVTPQVDNTFTRL